MSTQAERQARQGSPAAAAERQSGDVGATATVPTVAGCGTDEPETEHGSMNSCNGSRPILARCGMSWWGVVSIDHAWLKVQDAASYAAVSPDTIYTACERGELRHAKIGGRRSIRIKSQWIDEWLEQHASVPTPA